MNYCLNMEKEEVCEGRCDVASPPSRVFVLTKLLVNRTKLKLSLPVER